MGAVDVRLGQVQLAATAQVLGEAPQQPLEGAVTSPLLEAAMAGRRRWVPSRKIGPRRSGAKDPENGIQYVSRIAPRSTALDAGPYPLRTGKEPANDLPLLVGDVHPDRRSRTRSRVDPPRGVMRYVLVRGQAHLDGVLRIRGGENCRSRDGGDPVMMHDPTRVTDGIEVPPERGVTISGTTAGLR